MPNYRYNTPDYMRQNHSNGCHVGGSNRTMPPSVSPSTPSRPCCNIYDHDKLSGLSIATINIAGIFFNAILTPNNDRILPV